jgi:hypothetical protein
MIQAMIHTCIADASCKSLVCHHFGPPVGLEGSAHTILRIETPLDESVREEVLVVDVENSIFPSVKISPENLSEKQQIIRQKGLVMKTVGLSKLLRFNIKPLSSYLHNLEATFMKQQT